VKYINPKKIPSVAFIGSEDYGVPMTPHTRGDAENAAFDEFSKAAYKFCSQMAKAGAFKR
jgi:hypothetical protein